VHALLARTRRARAARTHARAPGGRVQEAGRQGREAGGREAEGREAGGRGAGPGREAGVWTLGGHWAMPDLDKNKFPISASQHACGAEAKGMLTLSHMIRGGRQEARGKEQGRKQQEASKKPGGGRGGGAREAGKTGK